ncbi:flotillin family protein [Antarcticirhabdus aurantiaca]|uniref:SPFH domain-containing protein n=1 Tax=Antarcticirhabdus aurantiaca TaxID=2606717 RepID=A0ACD4NTM4_9HYPH|nr:flotillin domain-containing protein [Antarcticirhabdus aurantiaca]WAJ30103.1 SPFH domain-containing protein [Jeongeuplla avenae]
MNTLIELATSAAIVLVVVLAIGFTFARLYRRAERDEAFVRTGVGGRKVVKDGGAVVLPILHALARVKLNTVKLAVDRRREDALITKDRMRVDIRAEFYVRVDGSDEGIALAAQTLGDRVNEPAAIQDLVEAKLVDALRSVAALNTLDELHENRAGFVKAVQDAVETDLRSNGLELETVSLTGLDQTAKEYFNETNAFDAVGLARLTEITEARRKQRNEITRQTEVAIAEQDLDASQKRFALRRQEEEARLNQERDIANKEAETRAERARAEETAKQAEQEAAIDRERQIAQRTAEAHKSKEEARIASERQVEIAKQDKAVAIAVKSEETSRAEAQARDAEALAVAAMEKVQTARDREIADRARTIAVIKAQEQAEAEAVSVTVGADAEKKAAEDRAEAILTAARAEASATKIRAEATQAEGEAEAAAIRAKNEANAMIPPAFVEFELMQARIRMLPEALKALMEPTSRIESIRVVDTSGFSAGRSDGGAAAAAGASGPGNLADQLLRFSGNKPLVDAILTEAGFPSAGGSLKDLLSPSSQPSAGPPKGMDGAGS